MLTPHCPFFFGERTARRCTGRTYSSAGTVAQPTWCPGTRGSSIHSVTLAATTSARVVEYSLQHNSG